MVTTEDHVVPIDAGKYDGCCAAGPEDPAACTAAFPGRSKREVGTSYSHSNAFKNFIERLRRSDPTLGEVQGRILRLKRYLPSDIGPKIVDAVIDALSSNTVVECLYIQNFERGMHDEQLGHLMEAVLKQGRIWAVNIGENFRITHEGWGAFLRELPHTAVSFLYVSEHHLYGTKLKDKMRDAIRENRKLLGQRDLAVINGVTNMWYNPKTPEELERSRLHREEQRRKLERLQEEQRAALRAQKAKKAKSLAKKKKGAKPKKISKPKKKKKKTRSTRAKVVLADLVQAGLLRVGSDVFMPYKQKGGSDLVFTGEVTMNQDGVAKLFCKKTETNYDSVSGFAIGCIRTVNPGRMAIDGWLCCKSKDSGKLLGDIRNEYYAMSQVVVQEGYRRQERDPSQVPSRDPEPLNGFKVARISSLNEVAKEHIAAV